MNTFAPPAGDGLCDSHPSGRQTIRGASATIITLRQVDASLSCATVIRSFIYGLPALLLTLIAVAFVSVSLLSTKKKNEMSIGTLGEPSTLNPIQHADAAAGEVLAVIFNGLLKYDANLEITTDLAKSFTLTQTTTVFYADTNAALTALLRLQGEKSRWHEWKLNSASIREQSLILELGEPGMDASRKIVSLFDEGTLAPLHIVRVDLQEKATETLEAFRGTSAGSQIIREWIESSAAFEVTVMGDADGFLKELEKFLSTKADLKARVAIVQTDQFLAEPEVVFSLRDDVRWHDGKPFTSRDVAFTYRAIMDDATASPRKPDFLYILRVETPDAHTVRVIYRKPYSPALSSWMIGMLPAHILEGKPPEWWAVNFNRNPLGTGPFRFDKWKTNEYLRVTRNPDYFNAPGPWLDSIVFRVLPDQLALRLAFETRQVDFWSVDPWAVGHFEKDQRFDLFSSPSSSYTYVGWNLRRDIFQDERVRRALAHAVNVPEMIKYILYGHGVQSTGIFTPNMWFFDPNVRPFVYDPEKARQLLAEAGWKPGKDGILEKDGQRFSFTLITNNGNEIRRDIATLVQDDLKKLGIEVNIELYEWAVFLKNFINKGSFDAMVLGWALGPDYDQYQIWHSSQSNPEQLNVVKYNNPEVDKLLVDIREEYRREKIIELAGLMQTTIYREQPYLFLYVPEGTSVMWKDSYRIHRPGGRGEWVDTPVEMTKAGWGYYMDWFYRPEYADLLPK
ncbi:MAG: peptide-binding protein [Terrimicrobiaceae bacterium]